MSEMRAFRAAEQLSAILETAALPPSARTLAERVQARLSAPVRIAVIGAPGAGKRQIVEGLLGGPVLPLVEGLPPAEITVGSGQRIGIVDVDGESSRVDVAEFHTLDPAEMALIRLSAPLPLLEKIAFLVVPLEGNEAEMRAALRWTMSRADMVLWCVRRLDGPDRGLWPLMPETMRDHAFLAVTEARHTRPSDADRHFAADYFSETRDLSDGEDVAMRLSRMRSALLAHVSRARREDLEGALIFLDHHLSRQARGAPSHAFRVEEPPQPAPVDAGEASATRGPPAAQPDATPSRRDAPATPAEAQIVDLLAHRARGLMAATLPAEPSDETGQALFECVDALEACGEIARSADAGVLDLVEEATDLMLLLQLEGTGSALSDGVALLLQLRRECEARLAA